MVHCQPETCHSRRDLFPRVWRGVAQHFPYHPAASVDQVDRRVGSLPGRSCPTGSSDPSKMATRKSGSRRPNPWWFPRIANSSNCTIPAGTSAFPGPAIPAGTSPWVSESPFGLFKRRPKGNQLFGYLFETNPQGRGLSFQVLALAWEWTCVDADWPNSTRRVLQNLANGIIHIWLQRYDSLCLCFR